MRNFIDEIDDDRLARRLSNALGGRGAFRRFKDVLADTTDELEDWYAFSAERQRGRARFWLADAGYRVALKPKAANLLSPMLLTWGKVTSMIASRPCPAGVTSSAATAICSGCGVTLTLFGWMATADC
jgi:hypothetical protein